MSEPSATMTRCTISAIVSIEREPFVTAGHEVLRPAQSSGGQAPLRACAKGIGPPSFRPKAVLDADLMAPGNVQIVFIYEPRALTKAQLRQRYVGRRGGQFPRTVTPGTQLKIVKVDALPAHRDLDDAMKFSKTERCRHHPRTRRKTIGLMPTSQTLIAGLPRSPPSARFRSSLHAPRLARHPETPQILMLPKERAQRKAKQRRGDKS